MCILRQANHKFRISIDGQQVEQVDQFKYFSRWVAYCGIEIRRRIALGKQAFINKKRNCSRAI